MFARDYRQVALFIANGLVATAVHFLTLTFLIEVVGVGSKGVANAIAASCGIAASFAGNKWFVFAGAAGHARRQLARFLLLYGLLALINGGLMLLWADIGGLDYRIGFVLISGFQLVCSFLGNRFLVFKA
jgi:putative flippase GtrA